MTNWEEHEQYIIATASVYARKLCRKFNRPDFFEDFRSEIYVFFFSRARTYDPARCDAKTFIAMICQYAAMRIARKYRQNKRKWIFNYVELHPEK